MDNFKRLEERIVNEGERWIFSADFNIKHEGLNLKSTGRIDTEIDDLKQIVDSRGIALILAHQGRYKDKDTEELDFVIPYLSKALGRDVSYFPENSTDRAMEYALSLQPGSVAVMGNVRKNQGEEKNDQALANEYAGLASYAAIGGFGKAHRQEASNVGILGFLPGFMTRSQLREMEKLRFWAGRDSERYSVAVLGGIKKEKITIGLAGFAESYDMIIPGGIVLNSIFKTIGYEVGDSVLTDSGRDFLDETRRIYLSNRHAKIAIPERVIIANKDKEVREICIKDGVPNGFKIVDFYLPAEAFDALEKAKRLIIAGTPGILRDGYTIATSPVIRALNEGSIVLGGDTSAEINFCGASSTGGGSALYYIAHGTTPVLTAMKKNLSLH